MFKQIMNAIITSIGYAQTYNQGGSRVFVMTAINTLYNNNSSSKKTNVILHNNVINFMTAGQHKGMWHIGGVSKIHS